jgi:[ribosomal protein S5]-alanine N-acetyltransferase
MQKFQNLMGERIQLVKVNMSGLDDVHEYSTNPEFFTYFEYGVYTSKNQTRQFLKKIIGSESKNFHCWFIRLKNKKIIGTFTLRDINFERYSCEITYGISPKYWGSGYFHEALTLVINYIFNKLNFHRISAKVHIKNTKSIKGLEKNGFKQEGIMREFLCDKNGKMDDVVILSMLTTDKILKNKK